MPRKQRSTWGSITRLGKDRYRLRWWEERDDGYARRSEVVRGTRRAAERRLAEIRSSLDETAPHRMARHKLTVGEAFEMWWLPDAKDRLSVGEMAKSTFDNYVSRWRCHVRPVWGDVALTDVRPIDVQEWLLGLTKDMASMSLMLMRQVFEMCVRYEATDRNPVAGRFRMPKRADRRHSKDVYTLDEMTTALDAVKGTGAYVPAVLCGIGSCRVGESLGARIDLGEVRKITACGMTIAVVDVVRNVDRNGHVGPDHALKTPQSERPVVIPEPWSIDVLSVGGTWLCDRGTGSPLSQSSVNHIWLRSLESSGIKPIPFRNLRNSWRTFMRWELGIQEDLLEAMMGHAGKNVGEVHYDRPREEVFAQTVADAWVRYRA